MILNQNLYCSHKIRIHKRIKFAGLYPILNYESQRRQFFSELCNYENVIAETFDYTN